MYLSDENVLPCSMYGKLCLLQQPNNKVNFVSECIMIQI